MLPLKEAGATGPFVSLSRISLAPPYYLGEREGKEREGKEREGKERGRERREGGKGERGK
jgi:hypothetical protein